MAITGQFLVILIDADPRHDWLMAAVEKRLREELARGSAHPPNVNVHQTS